MIQNLHLHDNRKKPIVSFLERKNVLHKLMQSRQKGKLLGKVVEQPFDSQEELLQCP